MRILFSVLNTAYLKNFEGVIRQLADRGHRVSLLTHEASGWAGSEALADRLRDSHPRITRDDVSGVTDGWLDAAGVLRDCTNYVQFLDPRYNATYRSRAEKHVPRAFREALKKRGAEGAFGRALLNGALPRAQRLLPPSAQVEAVIARFRPTVALFTPYVGLTTPQPAYLRAAHSYGAKTAVCVGSWDHLTSKSVMRPAPDLVTVWNETQKREAVELHGIHPEHVAVTGAQCFDHWFDWEPRPRTEFCTRVGLDPTRPFLLYTCFSPFKRGPDEAQFVRRWLRLLRSSGQAELRDVGVLVRPHPKRLKEWAEVDLDEFGNVGLWPRDNGLVGDDEARGGLFDSIHHSAGVVGINTSAMIEAGIAGRRVHTILVPEYWNSQEGTFHFRYLMETGGGLLHVARSFGEHYAQLADSVRVAGRADNDAFIKAFIRPHGLRVEATSRFVSAIEQLGTDHVPRVKGLSRGAPLARAAVAPFLGRSLGVDPVRLRLPSPADQSQPEVPSAGARSGA